MAKKRIDDDDSISVSTAVESSHANNPPITVVITFPQKRRGRRVARTPDTSDDEDYDEEDEEDDDDEDEDEDEDDDDEEEEEEEDEIAGQDVEIKSELCKEEEPPSPEPPPPSPPAPPPPPTLANKRRSASRRLSSEPEPKNPALSQYEDEEKIYYSNLPICERRKVSQIEKRVRSMNNDIIPMRFRILLSEIDEKVKAIAIKKLDLLASMHETSSEYHKIYHWVHSVCRLPIGRYKVLPVQADSPVEDIKDFLTNIREKINTIVYGHSEAKDQLIRLLAQWIANPTSKGMVIGIQGPMGCGKTTLVKDGISKVLDLPFAFIPLGGASDGSYLEGHSYTYEGSTWGKIVDVLMKSECMNPVFFFDELDKVSNTYKGEEIINILMHMTDSSQNDKLQDRYFSDFEFDLSKSLIVFSYNDEERINPILRDRMIRIHTSGYSMTDKLVIASDYLLPEILREYSFPVGSVTLCKEVLRAIIETIDEEQGVRNLKRALQSIVSHVNLKRFVDDEPLPDHISVTHDDVKKYVLNKKKFSTLPFMYT